MNMIHEDNQVMFHNHVPDAPCNENCYEHVDIASGPTHSPWKYFIRVDGTLREVRPMTVPHRHNEGHLKVEIAYTGQIVLLHEDDMIIHR